MKAMVCTQYGPPEVLQLRDVETPTPKADEVRVRIRACSVTAADYRIRGLNVPLGFGLPMRLALGFRKPRKPILGINFAGDVESVGEAVTQFNIGERVFGSSEMDFGCYAEYLCRKESSVIARIPEGKTYEETVALPFGALAALYFLRDKGRIQPGCNVLVYGASGAVGTAAIQLAKVFGAHVTGVCSGANVDMVRGLGADTVIDYTKEDFARRDERYDIVFDTVGKASFRGSLGVLKTDGRFLMAVAGLPDYLRILWANYVQRRKVFAGVANDRREDLQFIADLFEKGTFRAVIDRVYPFEQIAEAHRYAEQGHKRGNVLVTLGSGS